MCCRQRTGPQRRSICNPFFWGMRKFFDSIKAHLLIPQLVAGGNPIEILALGNLTHKSPRCLQVGYGFSDVISGCASSIFSRLSPEWLLGQELVVRTDSSTGYAIPGSVCEEHIDDLSQFATSSSRIQLLRDAVKLGKKRLSAGTASLGRTLSCKSTLLANDKSLEKLIVDHLAADGVPICQGTAATDPGIVTAAGKKCASHQWTRIWKGRRRAKRVHHLCKTNPVAQILTMTGVHLVQVYGHGTGSLHRTGQHHVQTFENGHSAFGKTRGCAFSTVA